ncbi:MAG TPA: M20/M25/M40 family metallo-hydrolase [Pyrinomonadaceae bacterium]|nr:M20/M25/M40 family metallo-hydrolase [Pyrinomonadaceae bacterium]
MRRTLSFAVALALVFVQSAAQQQQPPAPQRMDPATPPAPPPPQVPLPAPRLRAEDYRDEAARIIGAALTDDTAYRRLAYLGDRIGHRLSGSAQLERAIEWAVAEMKKDKLDNVRTEKVMVPHWVRGAESLELLEPASTTRDLAMLGLGNSIGTAPEGLTAEAVVVRTFDELDALGEKVRGKIVVYNVPFTEYGATVQYRGAGPSRAARYGAVAALVRSVGPVSLQTPHTGSLRYDEAQPRIPAAAVTIEAAEMMQRMQARGEIIRLRLKMEASFRPDAESANLVAELKGRERPEEIVLVGGHFDSWDVGQGAHDDGGGCMVAWEAIRLLKKLNLRPRRTIRAVLFTNEENGLRGANAYRDAHKSEVANHLLAIESDSGVFRPVGFGLAQAAPPQARADLREIARLLAGIRADRIDADGGGADIGPLMREGVIGASLDVDGPYFNYHHTRADTVDKVDPQELAACVAAMAVMAYVVADMPPRLR